jgi:hypothetical protein
MTDTDCCQRCKVPLPAMRFHFQVEAEPPIPDAVSVPVVLCASCLESMQRWMRRTPRRDDAGIESHSDEPKTDRSRRRKSRRRSGESPWAKSTSRSRHSGMHPALVFGIAALVVLCASAFILLAANFVTIIMTESAS